MIEKAVIRNPKRNSLVAGQESWYPYYAGYCPEFVSTLLNSCGLRDDAFVMDPWNGSGTTTTTANNLGFHAIGYDLNPAMVIAAKASLVNRLDFTSLKPLAVRIIATSNQYFDSSGPDDDPLCVWFRPTSATIIRSIEKAIQNILVDDKMYVPIANSKNLDHISSLAAFFYVVLFRTINFLLEDFRPTNPTWIKAPKKSQNRKGPSYSTILAAFNYQLETMLATASIGNVSCNNNRLPIISIANSCSLPASTNTIDLIISSPPYCTRIDYAVATMPELTLLNFQPGASLDIIRRNLIGTSTVPKKAPDVLESWGITCNNFLDEVYNHKAKASKTYYFKSHVQYFDSIFSSIIEIERVLKKDGVCALVVQDSYYKDIYNNLPQIFSEMAGKVGLQLVREQRFISNRNMAKRNPEVKKYREQIEASESVLCFKK